MARFLRSQHEAASKGPPQSSDAALRAPSPPAANDPAAARSGTGHEPRRGRRGQARKALRLALIVAVVVVWGHDIGTAAADLTAPKPETLQQLLANTAPPKPGQQAHAVAEPYYIVVTPAGRGGQISMTWPDWRRRLPTSSPVLKTPGATSVAG